MGSNGLWLNLASADLMDDAHGADEVMGARERHHVVLPSYPNFHVSGTRGGWDGVAGAMAGSCSCSRCALCTAPWCR